MNYFVHNNIENKIKRQTELENYEFINQLSNIAMQAIEGLSDYGHKLIKVEEIGNISNVKL